MNKYEKFRQKTTHLTNPHNRGGGEAQVNLIRLNQINILVPRPGNCYFHPESTVSPQKAGDPKLRSAWSSDVAGISISLETGIQ